MISITISFGQNDLYTELSNYLFLMVKIDQRRLILSVTNFYILSLFT
jgi:hypothetical protein